MTWYTGTCGIMVMGLLYGLPLWSMCVCVWGALDLIVSWSKCSHSQWMVSIGRTLLVVWSPEVRLVHATNVMYSNHTIYGASVLYYKSFGIVSTLLKMSNISNRPYCWTITVTLDYKHIYITSMINYHLIMLYVLYKQLSSPFNDGYVIYISTH